MSHQSELIAENIHEYLKQHEQKDMLRLITCGSVDDGKSTLIGRLLHDSKLIFEDQLAAIQKDSLRYNTTDDEVDLALLVDGLQAEREQGITIDVAYRYFSTERRKYIIADCPGHEQYTRNMATGASTCDLAIILVDAKRGVQTQTRRHSFIVSLLGVRHVVVAVNKMDLMGYDQRVYEAICREYTELSSNFGFESLDFVPISALRGDNVVNQSERMPWYAGPSLMQLLDGVHVQAGTAFSAFRFPVQYVNRPNASFRGYSGTVASGQIFPGDTVQALPSGRQSRVKSIVTADGDLALAGTGQAITLTLEDEIDVSRGDMLVKPAELAPSEGRGFDAQLVWMSDLALQAGRDYLFKFAGKLVPGRFVQVLQRTDINSLTQGAAESLALNEIGLCRIRLDVPVIFDSYRRCRHTGRFIVIDHLSNATLACGMIEAAHQEASISEPDELARLQGFERELNVLVRKYFPHWGARDISQFAP